MKIKDHPRVCGEKFTGASLTGALMGSPPRVRGKDPTLKFNVADKRITPACAGKRLGAGNKPPSNQDHPRVCGEKSTLIR